MKKKGIIAIIATAVVLIVFCILFLTGVIKINLKSNKEKNTNISQAICYVKYMNAYMLVNADSKVVSSKEEAPSDMPEILGISFNSLVIGEKIEANEQKLLKYAIKIAETFRKNSMLLDQIYVASDKTASVYVGKVKILFGKDEDTEEKIRDLRDFYANLSDLDGTLNMTEISENNAGYTFKKN